MNSATSPSLPADIPPEVIPILRETGYLDPDRLTVGAAVPPLTAFTLSGEAAELHTLWRGRPAALIFGSYT